MGIDMKYILECIRANLKLIKNIIFILIAIICLAAVSSLIVVDFLNESIDEDKLLIKVAILNEDSSDDGLDLVKFLVDKTEFIGEKYDIIYVDSMKEGKHLLEDKEVAALFVFPEGFFGKILYGENISPTIVIDDADFLQKLIINAMAYSLENYFRAYQGAIYSFYEYMEPGTIDYEAEVHANLLFLNFIFEAENILDIQDLLHTKSLPLTEFYIISITIFILSLSTSLFYKDINYRENMAVTRMMSMVRKTYYIYYIIKVAIVFLVYSIIFIGLITLLDGEVNILGAISFVNGVSFFVTIQLMIFNLIKKHTFAAQINVVIHIVLLFFSGGIIPSAILPGGVAKLEYITPYYYIRNLIAYGLAEVDTIVIDNIIVFTINVIIVLGIVYIDKKSRGEKII